MPGIAQVTRRSHPSHRRQPCTRGLCPCMPASLATSLHPCFCVVASIVLVEISRNRGVCSLKIDPSHTPMYASMPQTHLCTQGHTPTHPHTRVHGMHTRHGTYASARTAHMACTHSTHKRLRTFAATMSLIKVCAHVRMGLRAFVHAHALHARVHAETWRRI